QRDFVTPHNGLRTVVWQQHFNDIPVFGGLLISHTTRREELVRISSGFLPDVAQAAQNSVRNQLELDGRPEISATMAIAIAAENVGDKVTAKEATSLDFPKGAEKKQKFKAPPLKGEATTQLVWFPLKANEIVLCWQVEFTSANRGEGYRTLIDAQTGDVVLRRGLTE